MNKNSLSRIITVIFLATLLVVPVWWTASGFSPQNGTLPMTAKEYAKQNSKTIPKNKKPHFIAPQIAGNLLFDNGSFDGVNGLASSLNFANSTDARSADDIVLTSTASITSITAQLYDAFTPSTAQVEIYPDSGGNGPANVAPLYTFNSVSSASIGSGFGLTVNEYTFNTPGLTLPAGKYWICPVSQTDPFAFFCTTGNGVIKNQPGFFKSTLFTGGVWAPNSTQFNSSDFAFKVFGLNLVSLDHRTVYVADTLNNRIQRSTNDGMSWSSVGFGPGTTLGKFNAPRGVSSNSSDTLVFVADTLNNRIQRSTDGGMTWQVFAGPGLGINQVNAPQGVAYDEFNDILYIADTNSNRILKATGASGAMPGFSIMAGPGLAVGQFNAPQAVAIDSLGNVFVADTNNNRIQMFAQAQPVKALTSGWTVIAGPGTVLGTVNKPSGLYVDGNGHIYIADTANNRIQMSMNNVCTVVPSNINWVLFMGPGLAPGMVNAPQGVVFALSNNLGFTSSSGNVYVGDTGNNRIQRMPLNQWPAVTTSAIVVGPPGLNIGQFNKPTGIR